MATIPIVAPNASDPVSPMNILAGWVLNIKKLIKDPIKAKINRVISTYPSNHPVFKVIIPSVKNAIKDKPPASPSKPSVILTALLLLVSTKRINIPYNHPILIFIFKVCIHINGSFPPFRKK